ncbi:hypothetical protein D6817_04740 [Candidatus Pacearchaeota archaeon]|nr:MAG: hypothetical protein D6817_04740 [Candidatus Pacearchaeota archaeon]
MTNGNGEERYDVKEFINHVASYQEVTQSLDELRKELSRTARVASIVKRDAGDEAAIDSAKRLAELEERAVAAEASSIAEAAYAHLDYTRHGDEIFGKVKGKGLEALLEAVVPLSIPDEDGQEKARREAHQRYVENAQLFKAVAEGRVPYERVADNLAKEAVDEFKENLPEPAREGIYTEEITNAYSALIGLAIKRHTEAGLARLQRKAKSARDELFGMFDEDERESQLRSYLKGVFDEHVNAYQTAKEIPKRMEMYALLAGALQASQEKNN